ncbi:unnamed protein product [Didymodactylos carnosus]|uniref:Phosphatidylinositol N-acetylglucosaminyltransferase subunit H conserved domain-containing protein n=1 Tax=Didymodactylos carnosus TaxID=1234261 RepID=A0A813P018_9BILA|nr:unnamed protein product [Didymodactylos carnosus]CAF0864057.1 unnamed protein product [Didymodactylos carnosus]CAF3526021.1 unnamed protein product [Didymodactylos carnosus]CAF3648813.1 unnamed protein product [Didymodactylos carnosus]
MYYIYDSNTCENIFGESINYEILKHENGTCAEYRIKRSTISVQRWLVWTIIFTYLALLFGLHKRDGSLLVIFAALLMGGVVLKAYLRVRKECLTIGTQIGVQLTTTYLIGRQTTTFISYNRIKDIFINEGFIAQRIIFYLGLIIDDTSKETVILLFPSIMPRLALLKIIYQNLSTTINQFRIS